MLNFDGRSVAGSIRSRRRAAAAALPIREFAGRGRFFARRPMRKPHLGTALVGAPADSIMRGGTGRSAPPRTPPSRSSGLAGWRLWSPSSESGSTTAMAMRALSAEVFLLPAIVFRSSRTAGSALLVPSRWRLNGGRRDHSTSCLLGARRVCVTGDALDFAICEPGRQPSSHADKARV